MKTPKFIIFILMVILFIGCDSKTRFKYLNSHTVKWTEESDTLNKIFSSTPMGNKIHEYVLIENIPENKMELRDIMIRYFDSLNSCKNSDILLSKREVSFYKYTSRTKPFVNSTRDYNLWSRVYIYDQDEDYVATIINEKYFKDLKEYTFIKFNNKIDTIKTKLATTANRRFKILPSFR